MYFKFFEHFQLKFTFSDYEWITYKDLTTIVTGHEKYRKQKTFL